LARGDVLIAYDEALTAVEAHPDDLDARYLAALALARSGTADRAKSAAVELLARLDRATPMRDSLREDVEALGARLAKDEALAASGARRSTLLRDAALRYEAVADRFGSYYSCVNAATLYRLAGDVRKAESLARRASALVDAERQIQSDDDYWRDATSAEAAIVLGDVEAAVSALQRAASIATDDPGAMAVTRRQLRLVCEATGTDASVLDPIAPALVLHYCGHRIEMTASARFPPSAEQHVVAEIDAFLASRRVESAYGSLASGADVLIAEALLRRGARVHVVLPFGVDEFERVSVAPSGAEWPERFRTCLARAASVELTSDSAYLHNDQLFGYAGRIAMGHALNRARLVDAPAEQLAVWDEADSSGSAGTAHDVKVWRRSGGTSTVIALPPPTHATTEPSMIDADERAIGAIVFADLRGFSRLRDQQYPAYVSKVFAALSTVLEEHSRSLLWTNTWGDAIAAVFTDVIAAARCSLDLHDALARLDLRALGLPADLDLRVGAHAGPVLILDDPITKRRTCWGREVTRAARIEPRTPEGEVYVTDAFAALLALERKAPFATEYVGRITTAKDFETIPMYRLHRTSER
jgi:hypothetical protein